jgi:hypothetical protein
MRQVFTSVQPRADLDPKHPREGQAGSVHSVPADPEVVGVKWDTDGAVTVEKVSDLRQLG